VTPTKEEAPSTAIETASQNFNSGGSSISRIGHTVDAVLEETLWRLVRAEIGLQDLTPALQDWWCVAAEQGRTLSNRDEIDRLTHERDLWYACYANGWTPGEYLRRRTDALWAEAVAA
jgi:hypothetical protein